MLLSDVYFRIVKAQGSIDPLARDEGTC
jgi:hypothetical protein